ncbi:MAG: type II toxin-antitoxin system RelE/ParE family toxin [Chloracidobacterium sp.]|nr:type II toxin-antitoxin system RelE/ParE family toxin [Chloracidobacterium sp.]
MEYEIRFGNRALKDLRKLDKQVSMRILSRIEDLVNDLSGDVKKLTDHSPQYRLRVGDFRVLFDVVNNTVQIQRVLNRREAY